MSTQTSQEATEPARYDYQTSPFSLIKDHPVIKDSQSFIAELKSNLHIYDDGILWDDSAHESINYFRKIKINGSNKNYYLLEYDTHESAPSVAFPWKFQYLFDDSGKFIKDFQALRVYPLNIFPGQTPFLAELVSTSRGNGGHRIYKLVADTLQNIYEGYYDYETQTYSTGYWNFAFEPVELPLKVNDMNKDGHNDIYFEGKLLLLQGMTKDSIWYDNWIDGKDTIRYGIDNPFKKLPVRFAFLYDPVSGHFKKNTSYSISHPILSF